MTARIPVQSLKIDEGWFVADLLTAEDCEEAIVHLTREITHIDFRLRAAPADGTPAPQWVAQAEAARAIKIAIRNIAQQRKSQIMKLARLKANDSDRQRLIDTIRAAFPVQFAASLDLYRASESA